MRSGPGTDYPVIGVLLSGQEVPVLGKSSAGGLWIQITYAGVEGCVAWIYAPLVTITRADELPIIEFPTLPSPSVTSTITPPQLGEAGGQIAFGSDRNSSWEIYVMNADGSEVRRLTDTPARENAPAWQP